MSDSPAGSVQAQKAALRRRIQAQLASWGHQERQRAESGIRDHLQSWIAGGGAAGLEAGHPCPPRPLFILGFLPMPGEPNLVPLLEWLLGAGIGLALPAVGSVHGRELRIVRVPDSAALGRTKPGALGTREPVGGTEVAPSDLTHLLVPAMAFSRRGDRLGRGRGFFDAFLATPGRRAVAIGVAFECQVLDSIPTEAHDTPVDWLCTERGLSRLR